jgi:hypothetical protein
MENKNRKLSGRADAYLVVHHAMMHELGLKNTTLLVFARIYGFCKNGGLYFESKTKTARFLNIARRSVIRAINELVQAGLIKEVDPDTAYIAAPSHDVKYYRLCNENLPESLRISNCDNLSQQTTTALDIRHSSQTTQTIKNDRATQTAFDTTQETRLGGGLIPKKDNPRYKK